ncbi:MAG: hypothetical protein LBC77_03175 [Spirochaetaceae bacterium]|jgi:hypothetical protein|nr:hypothetical protein [Spirochaetaceae bacterium]
MISKIKRFLLSVFFFQASFWASSLLLAEGAEEARYTIARIEVSVAGRSRKDAILRAGGFITGEELSGKNALDKYIAEKSRVLMNRRELEEVVIDCQIDGVEEGAFEVTLFVNVKDTRNFIILPEPKYSSNSGFEPAIKIRDYNFLGAMMPLKIDLGYKLDEFHLDDVSKSKYSLVLETDIPVRISRLHGIFSFAAELGYVAGERPLFSNRSGVSFDIPVNTRVLKKAFLTFGFEQGAFLGEEYYSFEKALHDKIFENIVYMYSKPFAGFKLPFGVFIPVFDGWFWNAAVSLKAPYRLSGDCLLWRNGPVIALSDSISYSRVNWRGNFRDGEAASVTLSDEYNIYFDEWNNRLIAEGILHRRFADFAGFSIRGRVAYWFNSAEHYRDIERLEAASVLRGLLDRSLTANAMLSINFDIPFRVLRFLPSEWFDAPKLRYFNFELHISPMLDLAVVDGSLLDSAGARRETLSFKMNDLLAAFGVEVLVFPLAWRSIFLRLSAGWNLRELCERGVLPSGADREIYIGLGHHY